MAKKEKKEFKMPKSQFYQMTTIVCLIAFIGALGYAFMGGGGTGFAVGSDRAAEKAMQFINTNLIPADMGSVEFVNVTEEHGLYKVYTSYEGQILPIYVSKDGSLLVLSAMDMAEDLTQPDQNQQESGLSCEGVDVAAPESMTAYVVSYCPFGTQMQRILSVLPDELKESVKLRYIGDISTDGVIVSMHGEQEAEENHRQICIREEQSSKFWNYLSCFIKAGDTDSCLTEANIDTAALDSCMTDPSKGVEYARVDFCMAYANSVSGSPTLILDGTHIDESGKAQETGLTMRSAELVKTILCESVSSDACDTEIYTDAAATGFSEAYSGTSGTGSC